MKVVFHLLIFKGSKKESDLSFELVGAVPVLIKKSGRVDKQILDMSKSAFSEALLRTRYIKEKE